MMNKVLILDSGPIINLSMNGLLDIFEKVHEMGITIVVTNYVYQEVVDRPSHIPRFELGALRIKNLIDRGIIKFATNIGLAQQEIESETQKFLKMANSSVSVDHHFVEIVSPAEMSCIAVSSLLNKKGIKNLIGIDERTTRVLFEKPENLKELMSGKLHRPISLNTYILGNTKQFKFIRSSELVYIAYKRGFVKINDKNVLEALLYATKFKGCSISWEEINQLKKL